MAELIVSGPEPMQRWSRPIPVGEKIRLGRAPRNGWAVPWDSHISREHVELELVGDRLRVKRLGAARNPIFFRDVDDPDFELMSGEQFRIGQTVFQLLLPDLADHEPTVVEERLFHPDELRSFAFRDADKRLEVLAKLPKAISQTTNDEDLANCVVRLLLEAIKSAEAAAVVSFAELTPEARPRMMRWDCRRDSIGRFMPSRRLMLKAIQTGQGLMYIWRDQNKSDPEYTVCGSLDWAFCMPLLGEGCHGWCLYVSGQRSESEANQEANLRFTELMAEFISSIRQIRVLSRQQAGMAQFFSPAVIEAIRDEKAEQMLQPNESDITVLFCDVRGFSKKSEQAQSNLRELLARVSEALGVMTCGIIKYDGVIADFQGDAALGFWGWPAPHDDDRLSACRAALQVQREFRRAMSDPTHALSGFQVGIGVAYGRAIAGRIGTAEQIKVGVFGPTVNLGSRLEGLTKQLRASILIDEATAEYARRHLPTEEGRVRKLGLFRPAGMSTELWISQLLPPVSEDDSVSNQDIALYESALAEFTAGHWGTALEQLNKLPVHDRTKDFLQIHIGVNGYEPPAEWNGVIVMQSK